MADQPYARWGFMRRLVVHKKGDSADVYLDRLRIVQTPWFGVYLHRIPRPDADRDPHDHPWWFASIVLRGWYVEERYCRPSGSSTQQDRMARMAPIGRRRRRRFSIATTALSEAHRIDRVPESGNLLTLVFVGPKVRQWGFWKLRELGDSRQWIPWDEYEHVGANQEAYAK